MSAEQRPSEPRPGAPRMEQEDNTVAGILGRGLGVQQTLDALVEALRAWHDARGYECVASSEGQWCCVDYLTGAATTSDQEQRAMSTRPSAPSDGVPR